MMTFDDIAKMERENAKLRQKELQENYSKLSPEGQIELVMLSRKLREKELSDGILQGILKGFDKLDDEGKAQYMAYLEALTHDPRYRK